MATAAGAAGWAVGVGVAMVMGVEVASVDNLSGCVLSFSMVRGAYLAVEAVVSRLATADRRAEGRAVWASSPASRCCGAIVIVVVATTSLAATVVILDPGCPVAVSLAIVGAAAGLAKAATGAAAAGVAASAATAETRLFMVVMALEVLLGVAAVAGAVVEVTGVGTLSGCDWSFVVVQGAGSAVGTLVVTTAETADRLPEGRAVCASSPTSHCCGAIVFVVATGEAAAAATTEARLLVVVAIEGMAEDTPSWPVRLVQPMSWSWLLQLILPLPRVSAVDPALYSWSLTARRSRSAIKADTLSFKSMFCSIMLRFSASSAALDARSLTLSSLNNTAAVCTMLTTFCQARTISAWASNHAWKKKRSG